MTETKSSQKQQDWFTVQSAYWDKLFAATREKIEEQVKDMSNDQNPWAEFFKIWQTSPGMSSDVPDWQKMFRNSGQWHLDMLHAFDSEKAKTQDYSSVIEAWISQMDSALRQIQLSGVNPVDFTDAGKSYADYARKVQDLWGVTNPISAFFAHGHKGFHSASAGFDPFGLSSMPAIGYTREKQERYQEFLNAWNAYTRKMGAYNAIMAKVGLDALEAFQAYLKNPPEDAEPLTSIKAVFAKWVDVSEDVYAEFAMTEDYTKPYGEVVNALMQCRIKFNAIVEGMADELDLPTRKEIDSLHERVQILRRENRILHDALDEIRGTAKAVKPAPKAKAAKAQIARKAPPKKKPVKAKTAKTPSKSSKTKRSKK